MSIITNIRTIRLAQFPNSIWVEIETDEQLIGLGEAWRGTAAVETIIHNVLVHLHDRSGDGLPAE